MKSLSRLFYLVLGLVLVALVPQKASAAFAPSSVGSAIEKSSVVQVEQVRRGGGRGWGGRGFRGGHAIRGRHYGVHRFGVPRYGYRRGHWGRPVYWGRPAYWGYPSCIRRGWVWNGWRYVWRRYRVC